MTTILLVGPYRRAVFGNLFESKKWKKLNANSVHTVSNQNMNVTPVEEMDEVI